MTQLIVRPIDDERYSKSSQLHYITMLKDHKSSAYSDALIKFTLDNYHSEMSKAIDAFAKRVRVAVQSIADAFSKTKANKQQSHGIVHGSENVIRIALERGEYIISKDEYEARRKFLDKHYESENVDRSINDDGDVKITINVPN